MVRHRKPAVSRSSQLKAFAKIRGKGEVGSLKLEVGGQKSDVGSQNLKDNFFT
jgi:hypothetical protein